MRTIAERSGKLVTDSSAPARTWTEWLPGIQMLREYRLAWLRNDLMAGIVLSTMLIPQLLLQAQLPLPALRSLKFGYILVLKQM